MKNFRWFVILIWLRLNVPAADAQEGIPVYYDYLSDNLTLIHPAMAGASTCSKIRLTGRMQWMGVEDFPMLQTLSINAHLGERSGYAITAYNDRNGYHRQTGMEWGFAHHLTLSEGEKVNKLSLGISTLLALDHLVTTPYDDTDPDPAAPGGTRSGTYFNVNVGIAYHYDTFFALFTIKNLLNRPRPLYSDAENPHLQNYIFGTGVFTNKTNHFHLEPSMMVQFKNPDHQWITDLNIKFYHDLSGGSLFYGVSYRYYPGPGGQSPLQDFTPLLGLYAGKFYLSYQYTHQMAEATFSQSGFHQISLGYNFDCRPHVYRYACPHLK